jgi:putative toxin-antitoxin system antitoxin component (TIGR02293 family)
MSQASALPKKRSALRERAERRSIVAAYVRGKDTELGREVFAPGKLIEKLKAGLPVSELEALRAELEVPMEKLAPMLGISKATYHRRKLSGRLEAAESDRLVRFARLLGMAATVMESLAAARRWLTSPQVGLGGAVPLEYAETEIGAREVEDLLGRIEYGVYS